MALKDVFANVLGSVFGQKTGNIAKSEVIDTDDINKIPAAMLEELSNGKGKDE